PSSTLPPDQTPASTLPVRVPWPGFWWRRVWMQLKKPVRAALAAASCSLLGLSGAVSAEASGPWKFDTALLYYKEVDRITVLEPVINGKKEFKDENFLSIKLVLDSISGASPNGAVAANTPQTFTGPSGEEEFEVPAGETPLDPGFKDTRGSATLTWEQPVFQNTKGAVSGYFSSEYDYLSAGSSLSLAHDFNKKNTTLSSGFAIELDRISPVGGVPEPLKNTPKKLGDPRPRDGANKEKIVVDFLLGLTQVVSRQTLAQMNYSASLASGYNTDPYKIVSVINGTTGNTEEYIYEKRPDKRFKQSLFLQLKHHFSRDVIDGSYRLMLDDWGVTSHTVDLKYRWEIFTNGYLEPSVRLYTQSAVDFFHPSLVKGQVPGNISADYRLADLTGITVGIKHGMTFKNGHALSFKGEYFEQSVDSSPEKAIGSQKGLNLFPKVKAFILKLFYSF
ncbi:MAG: DUF3570 domain-containing protein, partial [Nitrospinota bacterium]